MEKYRVEDVYKTEGIPNLTFVEPLNYGEVLVDFRNPTKPVIIEGQSGSGKTVTAKKIMHHFYGGKRILEFSGRILETAANLEETLSKPGIADVIFIDDFHRLPSDLQMKVGDKVKLISEGAIGDTTKYIIIGINQVGKGLIQLTPDLLKRIGIHKILPGDLNKTIELVEKGAANLNIEIMSPKEIFDESKGDYWLTQKLCQTLCVSNKVFETQSARMSVKVDIVSLRKSIVSTLSNGYEPAVIEFCRGRRFRPGNNTYFKLLKAISAAGENSVNLEKLAADRPEIKPSVDQLKTKRLSILIQDKSEVRKFFYYNPDLKRFSIEDPGMGYFIRNLDWNKIERECGFRASTNVFDMAVSFATSTRPLVEYVVEQLKEKDINVFYDQDYEPKFLGSDMEAKFRQIYSKDARLVIAFLDDNYQQRVWPKFEKMCFEGRVKDEEVVPIFLTTTPIKGIPDTIWGIKPTFRLDDPDWKEKAKKEIVEKICLHLEELESAS